MKYIIFLLIFIIFLFYITNYLLIINEKFTEKITENIIFLNSTELYQILINDYDNYYIKFYENDKKMRNISNINQYKGYIKISVTHFDKKDKEKIERCIYQANLFLQKINFKWFNGKKAIQIPWKIGCITGKLYENGLPHTRYDTIIISKENVNDYSDKKLMYTLIHEKVHLYQKIYKDDINLYLNEHKFTKFKERNESDNIRANPDLDNWIYKDENNNLYMANYKVNSKTIEDIVYSPSNNQSYEHPFEKMAIYIENIKI